MSNAVDITYGGASLVTTSDSAFISFRALYIGGAGNVRVLTEGGNDILFTAVPVGSILPVRGTRVFATNTTATLIIALS